MKGKIDGLCILLFLALAFGATIAVSVALWIKGISLTGASIEGQLAIAGAMFFPGISSLIVRRPRGEWLEDAGLKWGPLTLPTSPGMILLTIFITTITIAPIFNSIPAFGEELGWR